MIKAEFWFKQASDEISRVRITGHAGQNEYGQDIICAAVSALTIATINGLEEYVHLKTEAVVKEGHTEFTINAMTDIQLIQAQTLAHSYYMALSEMQPENKNFVQVITMEEKK